MTELKWDFHGSYYQSESGQNPGFQFWYIEPTGPKNAETVLLQPPTAVTCDSLDAAKQLAQRVEDVLNTPECPTNHRTAEGLDINARFGSATWRFCPDCGTSLSSPTTGRGGEQNG